MQSQQPWTFDRVVRGLLFFIIAALLFWLVTILSDVLIPFGVAFLTAYILNPVVKKIEVKVRSRPLAVGIVLTSIVLICTVLAWILIPVLKAETLRSTELITRTVYDSRLSAQIVQWIPESLWQWIRSQLTEVKLLDLLDNKETWSTMGTTLSKLLPGAFSILSGTLSFLLWFLGLTVIALYVIFLLLDYDHFINDSKSLIPVHYQADVFEFIRLFDQAMSQYFRAQSLVAGLVGVLFAIGFSIIGLPLAILFGLFVGLLNMVPYLQVASLPIAILLAVLHAFDGGSSVGQAIALTLLVYAIVQAIQDAVLVPRIMGNITGLSPVMILLSLSVWGKLLGFFGLIVAIPFTCLVLAYYRKALQKTTRSTP